MTNLYKQPVTTGLFEISLNQKSKMKRPIQLIDGKAYSATWLPVKDEKDQHRECCVVFDDSFRDLYSEVPLPGHQGFSELPFEVDIEATAWPDQRLAPEEYADHVLGKEPLRDMSEVFGDVTRSIDAFVAFDNAFADQRSMTEFLACWVISTYATDAFDVLGYLWPSGEKQSGKTQCLKTITALAYMGTSVTSSSSFAAIRDEAVLGATLGFDDCENIRGMDLNKRELLLAGNTKGTFVTLKVPGRRDGEWESKRVDAFAPRAFTSISLPDPVLGSRTILVPTTRSVDLEKTRRKPTDLNDWPVDLRKLRQELWLHAVRGLVDIKASKTRVAVSSQIAGRDFDIFLPSLAVASWLEEDHGVEGLLGRMLTVMDGYLASRSENQLPSLEEITIQALWEDLYQDGKSEGVYATDRIRQLVQFRCDAEDITEESLAEVDVQKIGILLRRLGFKKSPSHGEKRSWIISIGKLEELAKRADIKLEVVQPTLDLQDLHRQPGYPVRPWDTQ